MKKKMVALLLVVSVAVATAAGCGKVSRDTVEDTTGKTEEDMQWEADMQDIASSIEAANETDTQAMEDEKNTEEEPQIQLVKMRDEIANGNICDPFVQIFDEIIPIDGSLTVEQFSNQISEMLGEEISYLDWEFKPCTENAIFQGIRENFQSYYLVDGNGTCIIEFTALGNGEEYEKLMDCKVIGITAYDGINENNEYVELNMFYPGGICMGLYSRTDRYPGMENDELFQQRVSEFGIMNHEQLEEFLSGQGLSVEGWEEGYTNIDTPTTFCPGRLLQVGWSLNTDLCTFVRFLYL